MTEGNAYVDQKFVTSICLAERNRESGVSDQQQKKGLLLDPVLMAG